MPIYEYQCLSCRHQLETLQKISDQPLRDCPACGQADLKKKISAVAFRFKGSGWYETDFKTGDKKNIASDSGAADAPAPADSGSAEAGADGSKADAGSGKAAAGADKTDAGGGKADSSSSGNSAVAG